MLNGFEDPISQVMNLDFKLIDQILLQAVARVNRINKNEP
tara:strand:- start:783 stop:902 length:120 start_codon:yes stop_codon:yes gene_type:complete